MRTQKASMDDDIEMTLGRICPYFFARCSVIVLTAIVRDSFFIFPLALIILPRVILLLLLLFCLVFFFLLLNDTTGVNDIVYMRAHCAYALRCTLVALCLLRMPYSDGDKPHGVLCTIIHGFVPPF